LNNKLTLICCIKSKTILASLLIIDAITGFIVEFIAIRTLSQALREIVIYKPLLALDAYFRCPVEAF
jgi:hypothetical protein